jgi:hypothetical protein
MFQTLDLGWMNEFAAGLSLEVDVCLFELPDGQFPASTMARDP